VIKFTALRGRVVQTLQAAHSKRARSWYLLLSSQGSVQIEEGFLHNVCACVRTQAFHQIPLVSGEARSIC
jgi:hypothetical protein